MNGKGLRTLAPLNGVLPGELDRGFLLVKIRDCSAVSQLVLLQTRLKWIRVEVNDPCPRVQKHVLVLEHVRALLDGPTQDALDDAWVLLNAVFRAQCSKNGRDKGVLGMPDKVLVPRQWLPVGKFGGLQGRSESVPLVFRLEPENVDLAILYSEDQRVLEGLH